MKKTILLSVLLFIGCGKDECYNCTRTWSDVTYQQTSNGGRNIYSTHSNTRSETFQVCGDDEKESAEKVQTVTTPLSTAGFYKEETGVCSCK